MEQLISLSWQSQTVLVSGYLAYSIAHGGRKSAHRNIDEIFIVICFGSVALFALSVSLEALENNCGNFMCGYVEAISALIAVSASVIAGISWRGFLRSWSATLLRKISGNEEDNLPTAWDTVIQEPGYDVSQVNVTLRNGEVLESFAIGDFNKFPNGPCVFGSDGSVALYVTHIHPVEGDSRAVEAVSNSLGDRITIVPASEIEQIDIRRKTKSK